ncbi:MAG: GGDEF domain-containing protein [Betaproteobacteria bacterium]|nr:GGDEF domain-containing protein [Betaproteobacteria bacterium]
MESVELLKQNLAIEPDLQNFIGFVLESTGRLGGNPFPAAVAALALMQKLRNAGAATGYPLPASLHLADGHLLVRWGEETDATHAESRGNTYARVAHLPLPPSSAVIEQLRQHLQDSTAAADPAILLQRNAEMARHLDETRARTEAELKSLQQVLEARQAELYESLRQAETDPLTGLFNRRAFDEKLSRAFRRAMRQKNEPLSLLLFDLDFFKNINDEFGHQFGDAYLNKMAASLLSVIREDVDFVFRFGGDEFAMLIFADFPLACSKAGKVLELMENKVSIGITSINQETPDGLTLEDFIRHADNALYAAKHRGRGRAVVDVCSMPDNGDCKSTCSKMAPQLPPQ